MCFSVPVQLAFFPEKCMNLHDPVLITSSFRIFSNWHNFQGYTTVFPVEIFWLSALLWPLLATVQSSHSIKNSSKSISTLVLSSAPWIQSKFSDAQKHRFCPAEVGSKSDRTMMIMTNRSSSTESASNSVKMLLT